MSAIDVGQTCLFGFSPLDTELFENKNNLLKRCRKSRYTYYLIFFIIVFICFLNQTDPRPEKVEPLEDVVAEAVVKHWNGLAFREWNAG